VREGYHFWGDIAANRKLERKKLGLEVGGRAFHYQPMVSGAPVKWCSNSVWSGVKCGRMGSNWVEKKNNVIQIR